MRKKINLIGQTFGKLKVIAPAEKNRHGQVQWLCLCECGNNTTVSTASLRTAHTKSCGCYKFECARKHGKANKRDRLYNIWCKMNFRCSNPNKKRFKDYGGRGISVCPEWKHDFNAFQAWAMSHGYSPNLTLDRINNNGNYEPSNCRWATVKEQNWNKRNIKNKPNEKN